MREIFLYGVSHKTCFGVISVKEVIFLSVWINCDKSQKNSAAVVYFIKLPQFFCW